MKNRLKAVENTVLQISNTQVNDTSEYTCEVVHKTPSGGLTSTWAYFRLTIFTVPYIEVTTDSHTQSTPADIHIEGTRYIHI